MKDYFNSLNDREKWMAVLGGISLFVFIYYSFLYAPLRNAVTQKSTQLAEQTATLEWMQKTKNEGHITQKKITVDNSKLLTLLSTQLKNNPDLNFPFQLQQTASGEVQLSFDAVPLKLFVTWLAKFSDQYVFTIKTLDINQTSTPGVTKLIVIINSGTQV